MREKIVYIVHAIDTEGPLYESLDAKFDRLEDLFGISHILRTEENFHKLQRGEIDLSGFEKNIKEVFSAHLVNYHDSWDKIDAMLEKLMTEEFRYKLKDSFGGGWVFNWHCLDHVGFEDNPRRRDLGYHKIFDHYRTLLQEHPQVNDDIQWHYHPVSIYREAHRSATSYFNNTEFFNVLCRKIIEREWFPSVFRAGFHVERPDSNFLLEQWIPFDISNLALEDNLDVGHTVDCRNGRGRDWRLAPADWSIYHPSHDNYQLPGTCRRWIGRVLNAMGRYAMINKYEMDKAFARANLGAPTLVGITSHDFRDLATEVDYVRNLIKDASKKYPDVQFKFSRGIDAFRNVIWPDEIEGEKLTLELKYHPAPADDVASIEVTTKSGVVFGPQPFLAIKTKSGEFIHDNFDFAKSHDRWFYAFHSDTLPLGDVDTIGVAANDKFGNVYVNKIVFQEESFLEKSQRLKENLV